ncbi:hypothetical protein C8R45DRAFT_264621 [Mycena sanguinolenta]|nr:hypothetical protein C8R45DRAFT_264621 [Mycena sanguinolenta]
MNLQVSLMVYGLVASITVSNAFLDPRPRRSVKYSGSQDMWKYVGGSKRLSVQWSSWLTHTRPDPPTMEELQADLMRQERVRRNVMLLNARDQEEDRLKLASHTLPGLASHADLEVPPPDPAVTSLADVKPLTPDPTAKPLPTMPSSTKDAEPAAWMPRAAARGTPSAASPPSHADLETPPPHPTIVSPTMPSNAEPEAWTLRAATRGSLPKALPTSHADLETPLLNPTVASPTMPSRSNFAAPLPSHADLETPPPDPAAPSPTTPSRTNSIEPEAWTPRAAVRG